MIKFMATAPLPSLALTGPLAGPVNPKQVMAVTLWITGFLCLLNIALAIFFRRRRKKEVFSYYIVCMVEIAVFAFAILFYFDVITQSANSLSLASKASDKPGRACCCAGYWYWSDSRRLTGIVSICQSCLVALPKMASCSEIARGAFILIEDQVNG